MPQDFHYTASENGYVSTQLMVEWFKVVFIPNCNATPEHPALLLMDNHSSHVQFDIAQLALQHNIIILLMPPHSSHFIQPLDKIFIHLQRGIEKVARQRNIVAKGMEVSVKCIIYG